MGSVAPDFAATAVYDQEFLDVKLSQYRVSVQYIPFHLVNVVLTLFFWDQEFLNGKLSQYCVPDFLVCSPG